MSATPNAAGPGSYRQLSRRASLWTVSGQVCAQALRLGSNLILTRLLAPEFFGVMVLVNVFVLGLQLFSDVGLGPNIIRHSRGEDPDFLNTAWSIQIVRGFVLWCIAWALAGVMATAYDEPQLARLLPVAAISAILGGFESTARYTLNRRIHLGRITLLELGQQVSSVVFMVLWALVSPTIWALVLGSVFGVIVRTICSHLFLPGIRNRWHWERDAAQSLIHFGKWIFLGTALGFLANRGDRLVLGAVMTKSELGMFSIAVILAHSPVRITGQIAQKVLLPLYARLADEGGQVLRHELAAVRRRIAWVTIALLSLICLGGGLIVDLLWTDEYLAAGPMTRILAIGSIGGVVISTLQPVLLACGDARSHFLSTLARAGLLIAALIVGQHFDGTTGALIGLAIAPWLHYPVLAYLVGRHGAWTPSADAWSFAASGLLGALLFLGA